MFTLHTFQSASPIYFCATDIFVGSL